MIKAVLAPTTRSEWEDSLISPSTFTTLTLQKCQNYLEAAHFRPLLNILPSGSSILEAGCGYGQNAYAFVFTGHRCIGLDFSHKVLFHARKRPVDHPKLQLHIDWVQGNILNLPIGSDVLDCHASFGVLEHFTRPQQRKILSEAYRVLRPGGILYLYVPNFWSLWTLRRQLSYWFRKFVPPHLVWQRNMSKSVLRKLCSGAGFKMELIQSFYASNAFDSALSLPSFISRFVPARISSISAQHMSKLGQWCDDQNLLGYGLVCICRK